jgi:hypothetical protein
VPLDQGKKGLVGVQITFFENMLEISGRLVGVDNE